MTQRTTPLSPGQLRKALICFNREVQIMEENAEYCRLRVRLRHGAGARLYGRFFPLRDHHDWIIDGLGLAFLRLFREKPITVDQAAAILQNEHKLSYFEALTLTRDFTGRLMRRGIAVLEIGAPEK